MTWLNMSHQQKIIALKVANAQKLSFSMVAEQLECTRCAISGFMHRNRDEIGMWHQSPFRLCGYPVQRKRRPPTPIRPRKHKPAVKVPKTEGESKAKRMVAMAKVGFSNRHIANQCGVTMEKVRSTLSFYRQKGEEISSSAERPLAEDPIEMVQVPFLDRITSGPHKQCAWPLWDDDSPEKLCCGNPVDTGASQPYCAHHRLISRSEYWSARGKEAA